MNARVLKNAFIIFCDQILENNETDEKFAAATELKQHANVTTSPIFCAF